MSDKNAAPHIRLNSGTLIPALGFGVFEMDAAETAAAVQTALEIGYRHIDTAAVYFNEAAVGAGVRASGLLRDEVFVTTKLWNTQHDDPRAALSASLDALGMDHVDLYLIHWPDSTQGRYLAAWEAMQELQRAGLAHAIGVSNFSMPQLHEVIALGGAVPAVNQIEAHPLHPQESLRLFHAANGILTQAWSPLARGKAFGLPAVARIAAAHGRTESQVILRWLLQRGIVPLPKSATPARIAENLDVWDFDLESAEMAAISALASDVRVDASYYARFA